ncbi:MAG: hypothetical protein J6C46_00365 [Clostridia bacterium]|nr:hypothetical protein [Clostridia bacterium]
MSKIEAAGWMKVTDIENLKNIKHTPQGPRHVPVPHYDAITSFKDQLDEHGIRVLNETIVLSPDTFRLMYLADVASENCNEYVYQVGFINNNDRSKAFTGIAGTKVLINSAQMHYSDGSYKTRHTTNVREMLYERNAHIIKWFQEFYAEASGRINKMKNTEVTDEILGAVVLSYIRNRYTLSSTNIKNIVKEYDDPKFDEFKPRNLWSLQNTTAEVFKKVKSPLLKLEVMEIFGETINKFINM